MDRAGTQTKVDVSDNSHPAGRILPGRDPTRDHARSRSSNTGLSIA
jgi:hypothetical protein